MLVVYLVNLLNYQISFSFAIVKTIEKIRKTAQFAESKIDRNDFVDYYKFIKIL